MMNVLFQSRGQIGYLDVKKFIDIHNYPGRVKEQKCHNNADNYN